MRLATPSTPYGPIGYNFRRLLVWLALLLSFLQIALRVRPSNQRPIAA
jgi:hypothetical protein